MIASNTNKPITMANMAHDGRHVDRRGHPDAGWTAVHLAPPAFKDVNMSMLKRADTARRRDGLAKFTVVRR
jgi:hypothetical protein